MAAYVDGDLEAFDTLFRALAPRIHGFFVRRFGDPTIADDLLQVTFLKLHRARAQYNVGSPVRPWVFTIAARASLDELRRRGRRPEDADEIRLEKATRAAALDRASGPDAVERADIAAKVREALDKLPESQRVVVHLHRYEGMTFGEIGEVLGSTEGAVKLRAFRAYEQLRRHLTPLMREVMPEAKRNAT
ncbi:MAG: RNA polymerase sigma factor [Myxococcales bacterium]|nr:RNA polymerase sigma factor [Myxococcales bacterium]